MTAKKAKAAPLSTELDFKPPQKSKPRARKPAARKSAADTALASKVLDMLDAATTPEHVPEIDTAILARAATCIPDVETLDQMCKRVAEANRKAHTAP